MIIDLTEEQLAIRDMVRSFARTEVAPLARDIDREQRFPEGELDKGTSLGLLLESVRLRSTAARDSVLLSCAWSAKKLRRFVYRRLRH